MSGKMSRDKKPHGKKPYEKVSHDKVSHDKDSVNGILEIEDEFFAHLLTDRKQLFSEYFENNFINEGSPFADFVVEESDLITDQKYSEANILNRVRGKKIFSVFREEKQYYKLPCNLTWEQIVSNGIVRRRKSDYEELVALFPTMSKEQVSDIIQLIEKTEWDSGCDRQFIKNFFVTYHLFNQ